MSCYSYYYGYCETSHSGSLTRADDCNGSGLSYGARIGIGVGVAVGVLIVALLIGFLVRRRRQSAWRRATANLQQQPPQNGQQFYGQQPTQQYNPDGTPMNQSAPAYGSAPSYGQQTTGQYGAPQYSTPQYAAPRGPPPAQYGSKV